ncbi:MAG: tRNA guanosine(34) transglycosylase Tgt [Patescibacteria group bacterium]
MHRFEVKKHDSKTKARLGTLTTPHGIVETPAYVVVGTHAEVRCLMPQDITRSGTQMVISNTYHLWRTLGDELQKFPGLHTKLGWDGVIMTDSGGFQVFSMGFAREHGIGKVGKVGLAKQESRPNLVRITDDGAWFREMPDGPEFFLDAKLSIAIQEKLGADIILAFDECTSPLHDKEYTRRALGRTHKWARICLDVKTRDDQMLYGIVQGGAFEDLRKESAQFIGALPFDGFGIGGAFGSSFGDSKEASFKELGWVIPYLPENKPRHFLGMGRIDDLFLGVEAGIDTFDCVIPTREARHGGIWTLDGRYDIKRAKWLGNDAPLGEGCMCSACGRWKVTRGSLCAQFKEKNPEAARAATIHNVFFFNNLMKKIRKAIIADTFTDFKKEILARLNRAKL